MFEIVFLGTAAAVPSADRGLSALFVGRGPERFLVDCGEGTQRQLMRAGLGFRGLGTVLLTHAHLDHLGGLMGLVATRALFGIDKAIEILGSAETVDFARQALALTAGPEGEGAGYRLRAVAPGPVLARRFWRLEAFAVAHRGTQSLGFLFAEADAHSLSAERLDALGVPEGPMRKSLARGNSVVLADGRQVGPQMVAGADKPGTRLAIVGDTEETASLVPHVAGADALVIEATFLERDAPLARARGHLTAAAAAGLAREAQVGELLLTHISGRYKPAEIAAEAAAIFPRVRVVADFDRVAVGPRRPARR
ncbi:MAG TPA: MBL fold metallo-hydrolase [Stellaceae bacterium]|nr:MBL fold metallo-hydrolase [Stellaceae bacterium]